MSTEELLGEIKNMIYSRDIMITGLRVRLRIMEEALKVIANGTDYDSRLTAQKVLGDSK